MCTCVRALCVCVCVCVQLVCVWVYFPWRGGKWIKKCLRLDRLIFSTLQSGWESLAKGIRNMPPKCLSIDDAPILHSSFFVLRSPFSCPHPLLWKCLRWRFYNSTMCPATNWFFFHSFFLVNVCSRDPKSK